MSYSVDELFKFREMGHGYTIVKYLKYDDPTVTAIEIPAEYNGEPVTRFYPECFAESKIIKHIVVPPSIWVIEEETFWKCSSLESVELSEGLNSIDDGAFAYTGLKSVVLPKSLKTLGDWAFGRCRDLESVTFNSKPRFIGSVFDGCYKLPADITLMGLVNSCDLTEPFSEFSFTEAFLPRNSEPNRYLNYLRPDVLELAVKNDCFRSVDVSVMLKYLVEVGDAERLRVAEEYGLLDDAALPDALTEHSAQLGKTEITAYLLDLKKRKFGFDGGENFEL